MSQFIMRSSPMTDPAQVSGAPICRVTGMPYSACLRARPRAMGRAPALLMSSGYLQGVDVVLVLDGRAGDDDAPGVLLDRELDVPAELPAPAEAYA